MAVTITGADAYIADYVIVTEDWADSDDARKQRLLNVAERELKSFFVDYTIPDNAVYEYSAVLATAFNDQNKLARQGMASFSLQGVASFTFKEGSNKSMRNLIPKAAVDIINADPANENKPKLGSGRVKDVTM